jgi:DSF synthase
VEKRLDIQFLETIDLVQNFKEGVVTCWMKSPVATHKLVKDLNSIQERLLPGIKYFVLGSSVDKVFNYGGDLGFFAECSEQHRWKEISAYAFDCMQFVRTLYRSFDRKLITVALIQGNAFGGGLEICLACDHIIAEDDYEVALPETSLGIFPGMGAWTFLMRRAGHQFAKRVIDSNQHFKTVEMFKEGVFDEIVCKGEGQTALDNYIDRTNKKLSGTYFSNKARKNVFNSYSPGVGPVFRDDVERELLQINATWVHSVMELGPDDIAHMKRIARVQERKYRDAIVR